jgi:choline dehydrogenase-like flavoprotein
MGFLSHNERLVLNVICETLIPALPTQPDTPENTALLTTSAKQMNVPEKVETALERITSPEEKKQIKWLLQALNQSLVNGIIAGQWASLKGMPQEAREKVLYQMATHPLEPMRKAFLTFKRLAMFLFYADPTNPILALFGYQTPQPLPEQPARIKPLMIDAPTILETDVLVIGSGAGGGVVAGELASAGHDVIVVEKGAYYAEHEYPRDELTGTERLYERYGACVNDDATISILAGSTLGGGTTINWSASFRTPEHILYEWERVLGFTGATGQDFQHSFDAVWQRSNVNTAESIANANNQKLEIGSQALGYDCQVVARNVKGCTTCDFCNFGCATGAKQSTLKTYLQDAHDLGARILVHADVQKILHDNGHVRGAIVKVSHADGSHHTITIKAKIVVVSAGAIHTPAILLRSNLQNPNIGNNLRLHPTTVTTGVYADRIDPWRGAPLTRVVTDFKNLDGDGYGIWLENAPVHPGLNGLANPWISGRDFKDIIQQLPYTANIIILTRDRDSGQVSVDRYGQPIIKYRLSPYDAGHLMRGMQESLKIHVAAGALEVSTPHNERLRFFTKNDGTLDHYLKRVEKRGLKPNDFALFSAHQMSSARIGGDPARGAIDPTGQSFEVKGLYVADGSSLPNSPGVNPMMSIMAVAHYIAQQIKTRL